MRKNLNRKKFVFFNNRNLLILILIIVLMIFITTTFTLRKIITAFFINNIEQFSEKYDYQLVNLDIKGLVETDYKFFEKKLIKYQNHSIFLLPLDKISEEISENNWVKTINLSTNYKDTLFIELEEYKPIGIYKFNNKFFYFDIEGKIIEQLHEKLNNKLIIFSGQSSNLKANRIIDILKNTNFNQDLKIKKISLVEKRRWNIFLSNNITLKLSEDFPKKSIENFINIKKNFSKTEMNNVEYFDLRNINKTIIAYKK